MQSVDLLKNKVLAFKPDIVIILFSSGDISRNIKLRSANGLFNFLFDHFWIYRYLWVKIRQFEGMRDMKIGSSEHEKAVKKAYDVFSDLKQVVPSQTKVLVAAIDHMPWMDRIEEVCKNNDLQYLRCYKIININDESIYVSAKNDRHFNAKGCEIIAREIFNFMKEDIL